MVITADETSDSGDVSRRRGGLGEVGEYVAEKHQRTRSVAVVALVAHLHHLCDSRADVVRTVPPDRIAE
jgi:hypothetical protein